MYAAEDKGNRFRNLIYICCLVIAVCCFIPVAETDPGQLSSGNGLVDEFIHYFDDDIKDVVDYSFTLFTDIDDDVRIDMRQFGYMFIGLVIVVSLLATAWKNKAASTLLILASLGGIVLFLMLLITPDAVGNYGSYDLKLIAAMWAWTPAFYVLGVCCILLPAFSIILKIQCGKFKIKDEGWDCPNCGKRNLGKVCLYCGMAKPDIMPVPGWKCDKCGYITSLGDTCMKCGNRRYPPEPAPEPVPAPEKWTCQSCGCSTNKGDFCTSCGKPKGYTPPKPAPKPVSVGSWFCPKCGQVNGGENCTTCGTPRQ